MQAGNVVRIVRVPIANPQPPPLTPKVVLKVQYEDAAVALFAFFLFYHAVLLREHALAVDFWVPRVCGHEEWMVPSIYVEDIKVCECFSSRGRTRTCVACAQAWRPVLECMATASRSSAQDDSFRFNNCAGSCCQVQP